MQMPVKKWFTFIEETVAPAGEAPQRKVAIVAVVANPYAGRQVEDLQPMIDASVELGRLMAERGIAARADCCNRTAKFVAHNQRRLTTWAVIFKRLKFAAAKSASGDAQQHFVRRRFRHGHVSDFKLIKRGVKKSFHKNGGDPPARRITWSMSSRAIPGWLICRARCTPRSSARYRPSSPTIDPDC